MRQELKVVHDYYNLCLSYRVFSHDVTVAMLVSQNKEMAVMLVSQTKPLGIELYFNANTVLSFVLVNQYGR